MNRQEEQSEAEVNSAPELLILTGSSHTGKTTVAETILAQVSPPAAFLSVDGVLENTLKRPSGDIWSNIPLAYEVIAADLAILLSRGWFVVVESTFTYVSANGGGEFHADALSRLIEQATRCAAPVRIVQLTATPEVALARAGRTGRLSPEIVAATIDLHRSARLPGTPLVVDTDAVAAPAVAASVLEWIGREISSGS